MGLESDDRHRLPVLEQRELVRGQVAHRPAILVGHHDVHRDRVRLGGEHGYVARSAFRGSGPGPRGRGGLSSRFGSGGRFLLLLLPVLARCLRPPLDERLCRGVVPTPRAHCGALHRDRDVDVVPLPVVRRRGLDAQQVVRGPLVHRRQKAPVEVVRVADDGAAALLRDLLGARQVDVVDHLLHRIAEQAPAARGGTRLDGIDGQGAAVGMGVAGDEPTRIDEVDGHVPALRDVDRVVELPQIGVADEPLGHHEERLAPAVLRVRTRERADGSHDRACPVAPVIVGFGRQLPLLARGLQAAGVDSVRPPVAHRRAAPLS